MHAFIQRLTAAQSARPDAFFLMAGPCAIEGEDIVMRTAERVVEICARLRLPLIFKGSYRKANRTRLDSFTGIGDEKALKILAGVRERFGVPVVTDFHAAEEAAMAAEYVDVLQVPAFLSRQTNILVAAAKTGKVVAVKKGQFLSPDAMHFAVDKIVQSGGPSPAIPSGEGESNVILIERGTTFGYGDLVVDYRGIPTMQAFGAPVVMDCTHSLQQPNQASGVTGGQPALIETIARAAIAVGADGLFIETHPDPACAKSDGANMLPLDRLAGLLERMVRIRESILFQSMRATYQLDFQKFSSPLSGRSYGCTATSPGLDGAVDLASLLDMISDREPELLMEELEAAEYGSGYEEYYSPDNSRGNAGVRFVPPNAVINDAYLLPLSNLKTLLEEWIAFVRQ